MSSKVSATDVLDPNARTSTRFRAQVLGAYRSTGPNAWDAYRFEPRDDGEELTVHPGLNERLSPTVLHTSSSRRG